MQEQNLASQDCGGAYRDPKMQHVFKARGVTMFLMDAQHTLQDSAYNKHSVGNAVPTPSGLLLLSPLLRAIFIRAKYHQEHALRFVLNSRDFIDPAHTTLRPIKLYKSALPGTVIHHTIKVLSYLHNPNHAQPSCFVSSYY